MTHIEFAPYHNRHISFLYRPINGAEEKLAGVVLDIIKYNEKSIPTEYIFIPSPSLREWQECYERGDNVRMQGLQRTLDINFIFDPQFVMHT